MTYLADAGTFWLPKAASTFASDTDGAFNFIMWLGFLFFALIAALAVFFAWKYRKQSDNDRTSAIEGNFKLQILWAAIPAIILLVGFALGFRGYMDMSVAPANALQVTVTAERSGWSFTYPNGAVDETLVVPMNEPVVLTLSSRDVAHAFFVPAFRIKRDVHPNRNTTVWFEATERGDYSIFCTEYCGADHSRNLGTVQVVSRGEFNSYVSGLQGCSEDTPLEQCGEVLFTQKTCVACHSTDGSPKVGPTFRGLFGHEVELTDGSKVMADEDYLVESIMDPNAKVVAGFPAAMPSFQGQLTDHELNALVAYIQSLAD